MVLAIPPRLNHNDKSAESLEWQQGGEGFAAMQSGSNSNMAASIWHFHYKAIAPLIINSLPIRNGS